MYFASQCFPDSINEETGKPLEQLRTSLPQLNRSAATDPSMAFAGLIWSCGTNFRMSGLKDQPYASVEMVNIEQSLSVPWDESYAAKNDRSTRVPRSG